MFPTKTRFKLGLLKLVFLFVTYLGSWSGPYALPFLSAIYAADQGRENAANHMAGNQEQQPAAVAEQVVDQDRFGGDMAPRRKVRMHVDDVRFVMSLKQVELGGTEYLD
jgi:hypothetical protein